MSTYAVTVEGCDDSTTAIVELSAAEVALLVRVARAINDRSVSGCQPTMKFRSALASDLAAEAEFIADREAEA